MYLTERQLREIAYHRDHAKHHREAVSQISYDVLRSARRRWWNAYWFMCMAVVGRSWKAKRALVVGCGFGADAIYLDKLGADVYAFDLSPDMLSMARDVASREGATIDFREMPAENLHYPDDFFDFCSGYSSSLRYTKEHC
jgi:ubiquinone/menaquinone biosynthesis C-methylase UbiE